LLTEEADLSSDGLWSYLKNKVWADEFHEKFPEEEDREAILNCLRSCQASYAKLSTSIATLKPLQMQVESAGCGPQKLDNISTELGRFFGVSIAAIKSSDKVLIQN
jgi:hypothetical protein